LFKIYITEMPTLLKNWIVHMYCIIKPLQTLFEPQANVDRYDKQGGQMHLWKICRM
jgi:hypothetical protein